MSKSLRVSGGHSGAAISVFDTTRYTRSDKFNLPGEGAMHLDETKVIEGTGNDSVALQNAFDDAAGKDGTVTAIGTFNVNTPLIARCSMDMRDATILYSGAADTTALTIREVNPSDIVLRAKHVFTPKIIDTLQPAAPNGWRTDVIGFNVHNVQNCVFYLQEITGFGEGILLDANDTGTTANTFMGTYYRDNKVNIHLRNTAENGHANSNTFIGGACFHNSGQGTNVTGCYHIFLEDVAGAAKSPPNNNYFLNVNIEGNVVQYNLNCFGGSNTWEGCRWESTAPIARFDDVFAWYNRISGGVGSDFNLDVQQVNGADANEVSGSTRKVFSHRAEPQTQMYKSSSNSQGIITIHDLASPIGGKTVPDDWFIQFMADRLTGKDKDDATDKLRLQFLMALGRIKLGDGGAAAPSDGVSGTIERDNTNNRILHAGIPSKFSGGLLMDSGPTGSRPTGLGAADKGYTWHDETLGHNISWNGTVWKDGVGTTV